MKSSLEAKEDVIMTKWRDILVKKTPKENIRTSLNITLLYVMLRYMEHIESVRRGQKKNHGEPFV